MVSEVEMFLKAGRTVRDASLDELAARLAQGEPEKQPAILEGLKEALNSGRLVAAPRGGFMPKREEVGTLLKNPYSRHD